MPNQEKQCGDLFQLSSQELHLEPIKLGKYFMYNYLTTFLLSHWHQPDFVLYIYTTVQRGVHCNENPIFVFLFWEKRGLSPNFHIHVSVRDLYSPRSGLHISSSRIGGPMVGRYKSLTDA